MPEDLGTNPPPPFARPQFYGAPYSLPPAVHPAYAAQRTRRETDSAHMQALAVSHYIWGGLSLAAALWFVFNLVFALALLNGSPGFGNIAISVDVQGPPGEPPLPPQQFGRLVFWTGLVGTVMGGALGGLSIASGRCIAGRRARAFSLVMAGINCLFMPFGTVLGVFTFVVLSRASVQALYAEGAAGAYPAAFAGTGPGQA